MFPVGNYMKSEIRTMATSASLPSAGRKDSQGICFLGKINYNDFLKHYVGEKEGWIVELETGKKLGKHKGYWFHTIGQRKGLGLSLGPWFVVKKEVDTNTIFVSNGYDPLAQYGQIIRLSDFSFLTQNPWSDLSEPKRVKFKIRHTPDFMSGSVNSDGTMFVLHSDEPVSGIASGQFGVIYNEEATICLGSGVID
jgi:tRNA-specific 2-thiouridylase